MLRTAHEPGAIAHAHRLRGLAGTELGDLDGAVADLRAAARAADRAELPRLAGECRMALARALAEQGRAGPALRELARAEPALAGVDLGRLLVWRSIVLERLGRLDESIAGYRRALALFHRLGDRSLEAKTLANRGLAHAAQGSLPQADADLKAAERLLVELGDLDVLAKVHHSRAIVAARAGDAPLALRLLDEAEVQLDQRALRFDRALIPRDRCAVLRSVRLVPEARAAAEQAVLELAEIGSHALLAEAKVQLAECMLLDGDPGGAAGAAEAARRELARQGRAAWACVAQLVAVRAAREAGGASTGLLERSRRLRASLAASGLSAQAQEAGLLAASIALDLGRTAVARLELVGASAARRSRSSSLATGAWLAQARLLRVEGERRAAMRAARSGLGVVERARALVGATELRANLGGYGDELATLGLELAVERGRAAEVLRWTERWRAASLAIPPVRPPDDGELAAELGELRHVSATLEQAALDGRPTGLLAGRRAALERSVIARSRRAGAAPGNGPVTTTGRELAEALGDRALVEIVHAGERSWALVLAAGRCVLRPLEQVPAIVPELESLRFALRRLALGRGSEAALDAAGEGFAHAAARIDEAIMGPIQDVIAERPLVVVPTGALHAMPWAVLPSLAGRAVTVAPSAALWLRAERAGPAGFDGVVLVAGPGLPGGAREVADLGRGYRAAHRLTGRWATAEATTSALAGAELAHVAAHGTFRADNPLFSSLRLADGPLTVYDIERLGRGPHTLVLSACDSGLSAVRPGDELMGLTAALVSLGTATIVAAVGLAPDWATRPLMLDVHRRLRRGERPAAALAAAQAAVDVTGDDRHAQTAARAAFVCLGAG